LRAPAGAQRFTQSLIDLLFRVRSLHRDHREIVARCDREPAEFLGRRVHPRHVLVARGGVHHHAEPLVIHVIDDEIVDDTALGGKHAAVKRLALRFELVDVIGQQQAEEIADLGALHVHHVHVRDIEHPAVFPHLVVLLDLGTVVQRHVPAAEIHDLGAHLEMVSYNGVRLPM
jgi:hypothetical protein